MMRTRQRGAKQPCLACQRLTAFEFEVLGARGRHLRWEPMCPPCGEDVRVRDLALARGQRDAA